MGACEDKLEIVGFCALYFVQKESNTLCESKPVLLEEGSISAGTRPLANAGPSMGILLRGSQYPR